jgi:hypothetical protein
LLPFTVDTRPGVSGSLAADNPVVVVEQWMNHANVTVRLDPSELPPKLLAKSRTALKQEAVALRANVEMFANDPRPGCPHDIDAIAWRQSHHRFGAGRRRLCLYGQQQARLILANALDHLVTMERVLGGDGSVSLFSHTTLSRTVCEAAVRIAWLLDSSIPYEGRIARSAAGLFASAEARLKGAAALPTDRLGQQVRDVLVARSEQTRDTINKRIDSAGLVRTLDRAGKNVASINLPGAGVKVSSSTSLSV